MKNVTLQLLKNIEAALENPYRYDRIERYALKQVLTAAENRRPADETFIQCAENALVRHGVKKSQLAA